MPVETWSREQDDRSRVRLGDRVSWLHDQAVRRAADEEVSARYRGVAHALEEAGEDRSILRRLRAAAAHPKRGEALVVVTWRRANPLPSDRRYPTSEDERSEGQALAAARCLLAHARGPVRSGVPDCWPWEPDTWEPGDASTAMVAAGALAREEMDRLRSIGEHDGEAAELLELAIWEILSRQPVSPAGS